MRLGLTARIVAIGASVLLALWITLIAFFYWTNDLSRAATQLPPEQLKSIADHVSALDPDERQSALAAVQSSILEVRLVARSTLFGTDDDVTDRKEFRAFRQLLGKQLLGIHLRGREGAIRPPWFLPRPWRALEFAVAIGDDEMLLAKAKSPFIVTIYGLPAGMGAGLAGTLFACLAFYLLHREIRPLTKLAAAVDRIDPTSEPTLLPYFRSSTPEIAALVRAFDRLQTRLYSMTRSRMALIGGIQHDIRSFATRLSLRLEQLPDDAERERATADIADMIELLDNALLTSQAGVGALNQELLDLDELLRAEIADFRHAGLPVTLESAAIVGEVLILGDRLALRRVIGNIVDNAVKFGQRAIVAISTDRKYARITIEDEGPGFEESQKELLLEPFVRAEPSRARRTGGAGLGLAVVRTLVEAQGGTISLENSRRGGLVKVCFPLYETA